MVIWPLFAEQQFNAFQMVVEKILAVEIKMDYRNDVLIGKKKIVTNAIIEKGIKCLMEKDNEERKKLKIVSESSRKTMMDGGSSHVKLGRFIKDVMDNISISKGQS